MILLLCTTGKLAGVAVEIDGSRLVGTTTGKLAGVAVEIDGSEHTCWNFSLSCVYDGKVSWCSDPK